MKWIGSLFLLVILAISAQAQETGSLQGVLRENGTMHPLAGATVRIISQNIKSDLNTVTDDQGRFAYLGLRMGTYIVTVSYEGYAPIDVFDLIIERTETTRLDLTMTPADRAPFKRQLIRYRPPLVNLEDASIKHVFRIGT